MDFKSFERTAGGINAKQFLGRGAEQFLLNCDGAIYDTWVNRNRPKPRDVSLAETLKEVVKRRFDDMSLRVNPAVSDEYEVYWLFHHRRYTGGLLVDIFRDHLKHQTSDFLVFTQSANFKEKFQYDPSTLTFDTFCEEMDEFVHLFRPPSTPRLLFVVFEDANLNSFSDIAGRKTYLRLVR